MTSQDKIWHLLTMAKGKNARPCREWVDDYHGHEGISNRTDIEECVAEGYIIIGEDKMVRLSADGEKWLAEHKG